MQVALEPRFAFISVVIYHQHATGESPQHCSGVVTETLTWTKLYCVLVEGNVFDYFKTLIYPCGICQEYSPGMCVQ